MYKYTLFVQWSTEDNCCRVKVDEGSTFFTLLKAGDGACVFLGMVVRKASGRHLPPDKGLYGFPWSRGLRYGSVLDGV